MLFPQKIPGFSPPTVLFLWFTVVFTASCSTDALQVSGEWQFDGLEGIAVNKIIPSENTDRLILATQNGVYIYKNGQFMPAGLQGKEIIDIVSISREELLVGVGVAGEPTLYKTSDSGASWQEHMGNYGGVDGKYTMVSALAIHPENPQHLFSRGILNISQSTNGGQTWVSLYKDWDWLGMNASLLKIDPENPETIWAGGANAIRQPNLIRSTDGGATWKNLLFELQIFEVPFESTAYSIAIRPGRSSHLLLGLGVGVFRSTDLGESWTSVFDEAAVLTLANSLHSAQTVYAGGYNSERTLFLLATPNFGGFWQTIEMPNSPPGIHVNHIVSTEQNGREVLFLGTNRGLYSFHLE